jgi:hypothetical protein
MCTVLLPPGGYPFAVNKYININIFFSGSWFRASAMTTMNKNQPDAQ